MTEPNEVRIADLRTALERALSLVENLLGSTVILAGDYYWHVPVADVFDLASEPRTFTVGQLSDDLAEAVHDARARVPEEVSHELAHLIGVLRAVELAASA